MFPEYGDQGFEIVRVDFVICIYKDYVLSFCKPEATITCGSRTGIFSNINDQGMCFLYLLEEREGVSVDFSSYAMMISKF